jgi:serine/alanine adding enzyme
LSPHLKAVYSKEDVGAPTQEKKDRNMVQSTPDPTSLQIRRLQGQQLRQRLPQLEAFALRGERVPLSRHPRWLLVFEQAFGHTPYALEAVRGEQTCGLLLLSYVRSLLFGRFLVSLPYLNSAGVDAEDEEATRLLIDAGCALADELKVRHLELRHEQPVQHPAFNGQREGKVHMRLPLPDFPGPLWTGFQAKVRNQVRKGEKNELTVAQGQAEVLPEFYQVFSENMRDLGTPVYGRVLFKSILQHFPEQAELFVVRAGTIPVAGALLLHGKGITEVPSASSLREYNPTCANMLLYWNLLERAIHRGQAIFDFGRSTIDTGPFYFKRQWGAEPEPARWQYCYRDGQAADLRPDNPRYQRLIGIWRRLPLSVTRFLGPAIVRGIP